MKSSMTYPIATSAVPGTVAVFFLSGKGRTAQPGAAVKADKEQPALVAAPGRVEPVSQEAKVSSEIRGNLKSLLVKKQTRFDKVRLSQSLSTTIIWLKSSQPGNWRQALSSYEYEMKPLIELKGVRL